MLLSAFFAVMIILAVGCSIESPKSPTWDTRLSIPLISRHYDIYELIDRMAEDAISYDSLGEISISFKQNLDTLIVEAGLSIQDVSENSSHSLGAVTITTPETGNLVLNLTDYVPLAAGEVPDVGFDADMNFDPISEFESASIEEGQLILSVSNYFDLALDSLTIWIVNTANSDTIAEYLIEGGLGIGETDVDTVSLNGALISNSIGLQSRIHTPGGTLLSTSDKYLQVELRFADGLTVSSAVAQVPPQEKNYSSSVELNEIHQLTNAMISAGQIDINVLNSSPLGVDVNIEIPQVTLSGLPLRISGSVPGSGQSSFSRNIAGYVVAPDTEGQSMILDISLAAHLHGSGGTTVAVSASDQFTVETELTGVQFSQADGIFAPTELEIDPVLASLDVPDGFDGVTLTDAVVLLEIYSEAGIPISVDMELNGDGGQFLHTAADLIPGSPDNAGVTHLVISDITELINPLPVEILISGIATAGDGVTPGTVYAGSRVWGQVEIKSPLKFAIGETVIEGDVNSTGIDQGHMDDLSERLLSGDIYGTVTNHLPFGAEVELFLGGDSSSLYSSPQLTVGPVMVSSGVINSSGLVVDAIESDFVIHLSEEDLDIIENETLYIGQRLNLPGTDGQIVNIVNTDYLEIEAYIELITRLGDKSD